MAINKVKGGQWKQEIQSDDSNRWQLGLLQKIKRRTTVSTFKSESDSYSDSDSEFKIHLPRKYVGLLLFLFSISLGLGFELVFYVLYFAFYSRAP